MTALFVSLFLWWIQNTFAQEYPCYVSGNDPSPGYSRVYFTYPVTQWALQWSVFHTDNSGYSQTDNYAPGNSVGYPDTVEDGSEYYFQYPYILQAIDDYNNNDMCSDADGCGANMWSNTGGTNFGTWYCGNSYSQSPTTSAPTRTPTPPTPQPTPSPPTQTANPVPTTSAPTYDEQCTLSTNAYTVYDHECTGWACQPTTGNDKQECWLYAAYSSCSSTSKAAMNAENCYIYKWEWSASQQSGSGCVDDLYVTVDYADCPNVSPKPTYGYKYVDLVSGVASSVATDAYSMDNVYPANVAASYSFVEDEEYGTIGYKLGRIEIVPFDECSGCAVYYGLDAVMYYINVVYFDTLIGDRYEYGSILDQILRTKSPTENPTESSLSPTTAPFPTAEPVAVGSETSEPAVGGQSDVGVVKLYVVMLCIIISFCYIF